MRDGAFTISGNLVDILQGQIFPATLHIESGKIIRIVPESKKYDTFIAPGLVDAHVHIESSMLTPAEFARVAMTHGTIAAVCDPHEIANVLGMAGIDYMLENARTSPFMFAFGAPSCVPATTFETSGATIGVTEVAALLGRKEITHLSEVMNYPGVIGRDLEVMAKIELAKRYGKPIDGHAPGISGEALKKYVMAGITTDHETSSLEEAIEKIRLGMKILIRDGSAVKDFENLHPLIDNHSDRCMFCSDDKHPDDLVKGHMDAIVRRAIAYGHDPLKVLRCACLNPVTHYSLRMGLLREGDPADFLVVDTLEDFTVLKTYMKGSLVADNGKPCLEYEQPGIINAFYSGLKHKGEFAMRAGVGCANIIHASDSSLLTGWLKQVPGVTNGFVMPDLNRDILKIAVVNRYCDNLPVMGLVKGFGLRNGALASSVAHDSHNIVAVGVTDEDIARAVNTVIANRGGLALAWGNMSEVLQLPVAGLMSDADSLHVASCYSRLERFAKELGSPMTAPFITLSFMALLVIPHLKMSDKGLFDADRFLPINLFE